jgi:hypothetical protein
VAATLSAVLLVESDDAVDVAVALERRLTIAWFFRHEATEARDLQRVVHLADGVDGVVGCGGGERGGHNPQCAGHAGQRLASSDHHVQYASACGSRRRRLGHLNFRLAGS